MKRLYYLFRHFSGINFICSLFTHKNKPFVLCYHEVSELELYNQLKKLKNLYKIKNINELNPEDRGTCSITLDDCLNRDTEVFFKVAESLKIPVTFYLPVKFCLENKAMPCDIVKYLINSKNSIIFKGKLIHLNSIKQKLKIKKQITLHFYNLVEEGKDIFDSMQNFIYENSLKVESIPDYIKVVSVDRVIEMSKSNFITFESHSLTHPAFTILNEYDAKYELEQSAILIEKWTKKKVKSFCYPFGSQKIIGESVFLYSNNYYENSVTLEQGVWNSENRFKIPRIGIYPNDKNHGLFSKIFHYQEKDFFKKKIIKK